PAGGRGNPYGDRAPPGLAGAAPEAAPLARPVPTRPPAARERRAGPADNRSCRTVDDRPPAERRHRPPPLRLGEYGLATDDWRMCERAPGPGVDAQRDLRVEQLEQRAEIAFARGGQERVDERLLLRQL